MGIKDRWNDIRHDLSRVLNFSRTGYGLWGGGTYVQGGELELPDELRDRYVEVLSDPHSSINMMLYSSVAPFIQWKMRVYPDAEVALRKRNGEKYDRVTNSPFLDLIESPNDQQDWTSIYQALIMESDVDGNSYMLKERNNGGQVTGIYWVRRDTIYPDGDLSRAMGESYYVYTPDSNDLGSSMPVPASDVIHFRFGIDPRDHRIGISPLRSALRDVQTDNIAQLHVQALLKNFAAGGVIVTVDGPANNDDLKKMGEDWHAKLTGKNKGKTMFVNKGTSVTSLSASPKDMELNLTRYMTEERVSSLLGVAAIVAGTGAGLRHATYANFEIAQKITWRNTVLPTKRDFSSALTRQLLREFEPDRSVSVYFDTRNVAALSEESEAMSKRLVREYRGDLIKRSEARGDLGREVGPEDEYYYSEIHASKTQPMPMSEKSGESE